MKSATVFLVAVTVFTSLLLESSSTPIDWNSAGQNIVAGVKNIVSDVTGDVKDILAIDIKTLAQGIDKLFGVVKVGLKDISEKLGTLKGDVKEKIEITLGKFETAVLKVEGLIKEILEASEAAKEKNIQKLEELKEKLWEAEIKLKEAVEEFFAIIEELSGKFGADVAALLATVKSFVAKLFEDLKTAISKVFDIIGVRDEALQKLTYEKIQISEEAVAKLIAAVKEALAKVTGTTEKEALSKILEKCLSFKITVYIAHAALKSAVDTGNNAGLEAIAISIGKISEKAKVDCDETLKTLEEVNKNANLSDAETITKVMPKIKVNVEVVRENADIVRKAIDELLAKRYTAN